MCILAVYLPPLSSLSIATAALFTHSIFSPALGASVGVVATVLLVVMAIVVAALVSVLLWRKYALMMQTDHFESRSIIMYHFTAACSILLHIGQRNVVVLHVMKLLQTT